MFFVFWAFYLLFGLLIHIAIDGPVQVAASSAGLAVEET
jgi:hypothetical protein